MANVRTLVRPNNFNFYLVTLVKLYIGESGVSCTGLVK